MAQNQVQQAIDLLEKYAELEAELDLLHIDQAQKMEELIPPEVKKAMADIQIEYLPKIETAQNTLDAFRASIEAIVLDLKVTVKGKHRMAVWEDGRTTWKGKELEGFFKPLPELKAKFSNTGKPKVTIRKVGK